MQGNLALNLILYFHHKMHSFEYYCMHYCKKYYLHLHLNLLPLTVDVQLYVNLRVLQVIC